jgi:hypothetical protein
MYRSISIVLLAGIALTGCPKGNPCGDLVRDPETESCVCPDGFTPRPELGICEGPDGDVIRYDAGPLLDAGTDAVETPDVGIDADRDACEERAFFRDADEDSFGDPSVREFACEAPNGYVENDGDCDDDCATCRPGGTEVCDQRDNDCNGLEDDGVQTNYYRDADMDGYGDPLDAVSACSAPVGYVEDDSDCNDACRACNPGASEVCDGLLDENCRDGVDEGCACTSGTTRPCPGGTNEGECVAGTQTCAAGAWGACIGGVGPVADTCNSRDDDCNGMPDDGLAGCAWECVTGSCDDVIDIDAYAQGACAVRESGRVACWGRNSTGRVPGVASEQVLIPTHVAGVSGATQVTVGEFHACARLADGTVTCWGSSTGGKLGRDTGGVSPAPAGVVPGLTDVVEVRASASSTCARRGDGSVWCWGSNSFGQLGNGSIGSSRTAAGAVPGLTNVRQLDAGGTRVCALRPGGEVQCWGNNETVPTTVSGLSASVIQVGHDHHCAIRTSGEVVCWGPGADAEAGIGRDSGQRTPAANVLGISAGQVVQIVAGQGISCALLTSGRVQCWGLDTGDMTDLTRNAPVFVDVPSGVSFVASRCVIREGLPLCWLTYSGDGTSTAPTSPVPASPPI